MRVGQEPSWAGNVGRRVIAFLSVPLIVIGLAAAAVETSSGRDHNLLTRIADGRGVVGFAPGLLQSSGRYLDAWLHAGKIDEININVKFAAWQQILTARTRALHGGKAVLQDDQNVSGSISYQGASLPVDLTLTGEADSQKTLDKAWRLRLNIRDDAHLLGMREFELSHISGKHNYAEPLFLAHARREGIVAPRYGLLYVKLNGDPWGTMVAQEVFSEEMLESRSRGSGLIGRLNPELAAAADRNGVFPVQLRRLNGKVIKPGSRLAHMAELADGLFAALEAGDIASHEVFDVGLLARFVVLCELWNNATALAPEQLRFYLNPYTLKFEPIAWQNQHALAALPGAAAPNTRLLRRVLEGDRFQHELMTHYQRLLSEVISGPWLAELAELQAANQQRIALADPFIPPVDLAQLASNARRMLAQGPEYFDTPRAERSVAPAGKPVLARLYRDGQLSISNLLEVPVTLEDVSLLGDSDGGEILQYQQLNAVLAASEPGRQLPQWSLALTNKSLPEAVALELRLRVPGESDSRVLRLEVATLALQRHPLKQAKTAAQLADGLPWLSWLPAQQRLQSAPGSWTLTEALRLPPGIGLTLVAGTELKFFSDAFLHVSGPLHLRGTEESPVRLSSLEPDGWWRGVYLNESLEASEWSHVQISQVKSLKDNYLRLSGGVTVRASRLEMNDVSIIGSSAEDAIKFVRAEYVVRNLVIRSVRGDGMDSEFSRGSLAEVQLEDIGGDGIDTASSTVAITNATLIDVRDKAISVGEGSDVTIANADIRNVWIGVAAKESRVRVINSVIDNASVAALMSYVRKPEYGGGDLSADIVNITNSVTPTLVQNGSKMLRDGQPVASRAVDVASLNRDRVAD